MYQTGITDLLMKCLYLDIIVRQAKKIAGSVVDPDPRSVLDLKKDQVF